MTGTKVARDRVQLRVYGHTLARKGVRVTQPSTIAWVADHGNNAQPLPSVGADASSGNLWPEIGVEAILSPSGSELPPGHLLRHVVAVSIERHPLELKWLGGPSFSGIAEVGTVTVFPASRSYRAQWDRRTHSLMLQIATPFVTAAVFEDGESMVDLEPVFAEKDSFVAHAIHALHHLARDPRGDACRYGQTLAIAVAAHVGRRYGVRAPPRRPAPLPAAIDAGKLHRIDEFIDARIDSQVSLSDLAALIGMSVFRFARVFKLATGIPPHQYVLRRRIERAKSMLRVAASRVADVALECGFASQSHFTDAFHRAVGTTPRRFRDANR